MKDAMGNPIVIGNAYGYSNRANGVVTVIVGEAVKTCDRSITLRVVSRGKAAYSDDIKRSVDGERSTVSVVSNSLFPVFGYPNWEEDK